VIPYHFLSLNNNAPIYVTKSSIAAARNQTPNAELKASFFEELKTSPLLAQDDEKRFSGLF
jgi:hypothetical protein